MDSINLLASACEADSISEEQTINSAVNKVEVKYLDGDISMQAEDDSSEHLSLIMDSNDYNFSDSQSSSMKSPSKGNKWTAEEDEVLREAVDKYGGKNWKKISDLLVERTDVQCLHRWQKVLRPGLIKGPWTAEVFISLCFC